MTFRFLPLTIRLETLGGVATPLVLRGTPLPTKRADTFSTAADDQSSFEVRLWAGERPLAADNREIGNFSVKGIPPTARGVPRIMVEFAVDTQCKITARATVDGSEVKGEQVFDFPGDLTDHAVAEALAKAEASRGIDDERLRQVEAVTRANTLVGKAEAKLSSCSDSELSEAVAALGLALATDDTSAIREASNAVEHRLSPASDFFEANMFNSLLGNPSARHKKDAQRGARSPTVRAPVPQKELASQEQPHPLGKIFGGGTFDLDPQLCFVLMPFAEKLQPIFEDHIRPTVQKAGLRCERADDIHGTTLITWDIWDRINRARFVIADLTDINANVFYELGLAHAIGKDAILLTQSMDFVPFDLKALRCIVYEPTHRGSQKLESILAATIEALMNVG